MPKIFLCNQEYSRCFTQFRRKTELDATIRAVLKTRVLLLLKSGFATLEELGLSFTPIDPRAAIQFKGGETEALARLNHYFMKPKSFCLQRNKKRNGGRRFLQNSLLG
jgi:deoxyribodipyrimidine photo-lyase